MTERFDAFADKKADHEPGYDGNGPTLSTLANAIQCWALLNDEQRRQERREAHEGMTAGEAAIAFAVPLQRAVQAVEWHYWMFLSGEGSEAIIEHEGE